MAVQIQLRRDTAANWASSNPVLVQGEPGVETDTGKLKLGDGVTAWNSLAYATNANLTGDITSVGNATSIAAGVIINADINASAGIVDTKLATISTALKVSNSATTATSANTASAIVARDASGNFTAGTITAALTGAASSNVLKAGDTMTGALVVPLGAVGTPSLTFTGDLNTGIYSPGADQVAVATNGTQKLIILSDGKTGIGVSDPGQALVIGGGTNGRARIKVTSSASNYGKFEFSTDSSSTASTSQVAEITANIVGTGPLTSSLSFATNAGNSLNTAMTIDSSQRVGIGTSSPGTSLDVRGIISLGSSNVANAVIQKSAVPIGSYNLTITAGGGLTSESATTPTDALAGAVIKLSGGSPVTDDFGGGIGYYANGHTSPNAAGTGNQHVFYTRSAVNTYTERLRISAAGLVGIGVTSPATALNVQASAGEIVRASVSSNIGLYANIGADGNGGWFGSNADLRLMPSGTERARIDSSGRLLVGTSTAPTTGNQAQYARISCFGNTFDNAAAGFINIGRNQTASIMSSGDGVGALIFPDSAGGEFASIFCLADGTPGTGDYPGRLVFSTTADGSSSPTERMRISAGGTVGIGLTGNSDTALAVRGNSTVCISSDNSQVQGTGWYLFYGTSNTGTVLQAWIRGDGTYGSRPNVYGGTSDAKLKENIEPASSQWEDIKSLQVKKFNFIGDDLRQIGVIAQEVEEVSPGLVDENIDRDADGNDLGTVTKSVKYSILYMKAVKALQEAMERIEQLETEMAAVKAQLS